MPIYRASDIYADIQVRADAVVVGSGAGGAVAAHELVKAGYDVIVLERGAYHVTSEFKSSPQWAFENLYANHGVTAALGIPPILIPYGECVGGSTVINSGTVFRTPRKVLDRWHSEFGVEDLEDAKITRFFAMIERRIGATVSVWPALGEYNRVIADGVHKLGYRGGPLVRNAPNCAGCGVCVFGCPSGAKQSMLVTFIPAADALGARIYAEAHVEQILVERGRAVGVTGVFVERSTRQVRARFEVRAPVVILAAGAFGSPVLLQASDLEGRSGQVGRNLHIHPAAGVAAMMDRDVYAWRGIPQGYMVNEWEDEGIMLEGGFGPPEVISLMIPGFGGGLQARMRQYKRIVSFGLMVEDRDGAGSVHSLGKRLPLIRYDLGDDDRRRLVFGIKKVVEILFAAGAQEVYSGLAGVPPLRDVGQLVRIDERTVPGRALTLTAYHPMGTCRMGRDPQTAVVDSYLEAHDTRGLFITDASVFPTALGVNPQASIMAFAARTADYIHRNAARYFH